MTAMKLSTLASLLGLCAVMATAQAAQATDMGTQGGAAAQAEVGTQGAGANAQVEAGGTAAEAQVGAPGAAAGAQVGTPGAEIKASASTPITGALTVKDPTLRTFVIEGQEQVYVAPETLDLKSFEGQDVTVTFDANGRVTTIAIDREG